MPKIDQASESINSLSPGINFKVLDIFYKGAINSDYIVAII